MALAHLRAKAIQSLTERSIEAEQCNLFFTNCLESVLSDSGWQFIKRTIRLTKIAQEVVTGTTDTLVRPTQWKFHYAYPKDCLEVVSIVSDNDSQERIWMREGAKHQGYEFEMMRGQYDKIIATDADDAIACYKLADDDVTSLSPLLVNALAHYLATQLASPLVGGSEARAFIRDHTIMYEQVLAKAKTNDISQRTKERVISPIFDAYE